MRPSPVVASPMSRGVEVRPVGESDANGELVGFLLHALGLFADHRVEVEQVVASVRARGRIWVAREGAELVGCLCLAPSLLAEYELVYLAVARAHRRRGVARALVERARAEFPEASLCASVEPSNRRTCEFLEKMGFRFRYASYIMEPR